MTKAERNRLEKWAKTATDEDLVFAFMETVSRATALDGASQMIPDETDPRLYNETLRRASLAEAKEDILRAELLRRLGGAS